MLEPILLSFAAIIVAMQTSKQAFIGTKSPVISGATFMLTISCFMWATGYPLVGMLIVSCLFLLAIRVPS